MGGDFAPDIVVEGADIFLARRPEIRLLLFGDEKRLAPLLSAWPRVAASSTVHHTAEAVSMNDKPGQVLRKGRQTSMWLAVEAVKRNEASAVVSAGNTGALMAVAKYQLRTMDGVDRPAIASIWPKIKGRCVVLDVGANVDASAKQLADFAILGKFFASAVLRNDNPAIALLNIGSEELKGHDTLRAAADILRDERWGLNFIGFVEGDDITNGDADVVVTDGFTGNVALKTAEGTARMLAFYMREAFGGSLLTRLGAWIAAKAFRQLKTLMDPRRANGGVFLGLNGVVVKSHGGTNAMGFASALDMAAEFAGSEFSTKMSESLARLHADLAYPNTEASDPAGGSSVNREVAAQ